MSAPFAWLQERREAFKAGLDKAKQQAFYSSDYKRTLSTITDWFNNTQFDGIEYEDKRNLAGEEAAPPTTTVPSPNLNGQRKSTDESVISPPRERSSPQLFSTDMGVDGTATVVAPPLPNIVHPPPESIDEYRVTIERVDETSRVSDAQPVMSPNDPHTLLAQVHRRLSSVKGSQSYEVHIRPGEMTVFNEASGLRSVALNALHLLAVSPAWVDQWDRQCISLLLYTKDVEVVVVDVIRALILGRWSPESSGDDSRVQAGAIQRCEFGVVSCVIQKADVCTLLALRLPSDEGNTAMQKISECVVPSPLKNLTRWSVCYRSGALAFRGNLKSERILLGDIYPGRALWSSLDQISLKRSVEDLGALLSFYLTANEKENYTKTLRNWVKTSPLPAVLDMMQNDLLAAWESALLGEDDHRRLLRRIVVTRWREDLLAPWDLSVAKIVKQLVEDTGASPAAANKVYELMLSVESHCFSPSQCAELISESVTSVMDSVIETCLKIHIKTSPTV